VPSVPREQRRTSLATSAPNQKLKRKIVPYAVTIPYGILDGRPTVPRNQTSASRNQTNIQRRLVHAQGQQTRPKACGLCINPGGSVGYTSDNPCAGCPGVDVYQDPMQFIGELLRNADLVSCFSSHLFQLVS